MSRTRPNTRFEPVIHIPVIRVAQPDGSVLVKPGKPEVLKGEDEVSTQEFAAQTGLSERRVLTLIEEGHIQARPLSPVKKSHKRIPRSELKRYLELQNS